MEQLISHAILEAVRPHLEALLVAAVTGAVSWAVGKAQEAGGPLARYLGPKKGS